MYAFTCGKDSVMEGHCGKWPKIPAKKLVRIHLPILPIYLFGNLVRNFYENHKKCRYSMSLNNCAFATITVYFLKNDARAL